MCKIQIVTKVELTNSKNSSQEYVATPSFSASSLCWGVTFPKLTIATKKRQIIKLSLRMNWKEIFSHLQLTFYVLRCLGKSFEHLKRQVGVE